MRADLFLVEHGYARSRAEARAAIAAGKVRANGKTIAKPAQAIGQGAAVEYESAHPYVSRGALKLVAALDRFELSPENLVCLDLGASTGGFTQVLLERGAQKVFAIDVGHGQLDPKVATDSRVISLEGLNARDLTAEHVAGRPQAIAADMSFISLKLALPPALMLAAPGAWLIALVKPQFEAGPEHIGKGGIVKDEAARATALASVVGWISSVPGWSVLGTMDSPIEGGSGNREYLLAARKS